MSSGSVSSAAVVVRPARAADDDVRDAFVRAHPQGSFFHLTGWRRVIAHVFGHAPCEFTAWRGAQLVGVLPMMRCRAPLGGAALISMPYAVYGGALADDEATRAELVNVAMAEARQQRVGRLELRCEAALDLPGLVSHELYATFVRELPDTVEEVLARMPKKARAEARRGRERFHLRLDEGLWYLDDLHRLFHQNKRALGSPGLPLQLFRALSAEFGDAVRVHLVHAEREPVCAVMSFLWRDTCMAYYAGSRPGADRTLSASNFLYMALQEWCVGQGLKQFDFGRSRRDSGAFLFKTHQGFEGRDLPYRLCLVRDRAAPSFTPSNPRTLWLRETWSRLPPWACTKLSDVLAPYLP